MLLANWLLPYNKNKQKKTPTTTKKKTTDPTLCLNLYLFFFSPEIESGIFLKSQNESGGFTVLTCAVTLVVMSLLYYMYVFLFFSFCAVAFLPM